MATLESQLGAFRSAAARELAPSARGDGATRREKTELARFSERGSSVSPDGPDGRGPEWDANVAIRNKTIKKVTEDIHHYNFNTAVAALMEYVNELYKVGASEEDLVVLAKLLKPFAPHLASEMLERLGSDDEWPKWDEKCLVEDTVEIVVQINGKLRAKFTVPIDVATDEARVRELAFADEKVSKYATSDTAKKVIFVPKSHLLNIVV